MTKLDIDSLFKELRKNYPAYKLGDKIIIDLLNEKDKIATLHITKDKKVEICISKELSTIILQPIVARKILKQMIEIIDKMEEFTKYDKSVLK